jgi:Sulfotransferase family
LEVTRARQDTGRTDETTPVSTGAAARRGLWNASFYAATVARVLPRAGLQARHRFRPRDERTVFVVGSPRSGTSFVARSIGSLPGFVDLGEVTPLKAAIPALAGAPDGEAGQGVRRRLERVRTLALVPGLRSVEQTPELAFVLPSAMLAYPQGIAIHMIRDGRDVVCSLLERGWLRENHGGRDDAKQPYGAYARFWVEPELAETFERVSDARRAAWAWRRYVEAVRQQEERVVEVRYEQLVTDSKTVAEEVAGHLGVPPGPLVDALAAAHSDSVGRYHAELTAEELADVELEAGPLLAELGYR